MTKHAHIIPKVIWCELCGWSMHDGHDHVSDMIKEGLLTYSINNPSNNHLPTINTNHNCPLINHSTIPNHPLPSIQPYTNHIATMATNQSHEPTHLATTGLHSTALHRWPLPRRHRRWRSCRNGAVQAAQEEAAAAVVAWRRRRPLGPAGIGDAKWWLMMVG